MHPYHGLLLSNKWAGVGLPSPGHMWIRPKRIVMVKSRRSPHQGTSFVCLGICWEEGRVGETKEFYRVVKLFWAIQGQRTLGKLSVLAS